MRKFDVLEVADMRRVVFPVKDNGDDIYLPFLVDRTFTGKIGSCSAHYLHQFGLVSSYFGIKIIGRSCIRLHFDEHHDTPLSGDDVELSPGLSVVSSEDIIPSVPEEFSRDAFCDMAKSRSLEHVFH